MPVESPWAFRRLPKGSQESTRMPRSDGPLRLEPNPKVILHLLPVSAFAEATAVDLEAAQMLSTQEFQPMGPPHSCGPQFNFDGYLVSSEIGKPPLCDSYVQLFRNGR